MTGPLVEGAGLVQPPCVSSGQACGREGEVSPRGSIRYFDVQRSGLVEAALEEPHFGEGVMLRAARAVEASLTASP